jgi:hypothetical protein
MTDLHCPTCGHSIDQPASYKGEDNPNSKLTKNDVSNIRDLMTAGHTQVSIARAYGVHESTISLIKKGKRWGDD